MCISGRNTFQNNYEITSKRQLLEPNVQFWYLHHPALSNSLLFRRCKVHIAGLRQQIEQCQGRFYVKVEATHPEYSGKSTENPRKTYFYICCWIFGVILIKYLGFWSK